MIKNQILAGQAGSISVVQHIQYINLYIYIHVYIFIQKEDYRWVLIEYTTYNM